MVRIAQRVTCMMLLGVVLGFAAPARGQALIPLVVAVDTMRQAYGLAAGADMERERLDALVSTLRSGIEQQDRMLSDAGGIGTLVTESVRRGFRERDLVALRDALSRFEHGAGSLDELSVLASDVNRLVARIGTYEDYAILPAFLAASALQIAVLKAIDAEPGQLREARQQQLAHLRRLAGGAEAPTSSSEAVLVSAIAAAQSELDAVTSTLEGIDGYAFAIAEIVRKRHATYEVSRIELVARTHGAVEPSLVQRRRRISACADGRKPERCEISRRYATVLRWSNFALLHVAGRRGVATGCLHDDSSVWEYGFANVDAHVEAARACLTRHLDELGRTRDAAAIELDALRGVRTVALEAEADIAAALGGMMPETGEAAR